MLSHNLCDDSDLILNGREVKPSPFAQNYYYDVAED